MHTLNKKKFILDAILISVLMITGILAAIIIRAARGEGSVVAVSVNGERTAEYSLSESGEYPIAEGGNILVIENGEAYISFADCPDGLCVRMGKISRSGERIVCLPNRVIVEILEN